MADDAPDPAAGEVDASPAEDAPDQSARARFERGEDDIPLRLEVRHRPIAWPPWESRA